MTPWPSSAFEVADATVDDAKAAGGATGPETTGNSKAARPASASR